MGVYGEPLPFRVNGKVNLAKSRDIKDEAGVCVESANVAKAISNQKQFKKKRFSFVKLIVAIPDILANITMAFVKLFFAIINIFDTINMALLNMRKALIPWFVVLILIGVHLLRMWLEDLYGEAGISLAIIIVFSLSVANVCMAFIIHAINSVLHNKSAN